MTTYNPIQGGTDSASDSSDTIQVSFLCEGCQQPDDVARKLAAFLGQARKSLDISVYSLSLCGSSFGIISNALKERAQAGVQIRIAYDAGSQQSQMPGLYNDPCAADTGEVIQSLGFPSKAIEGYQALMHDKYVVVDDGTPGAQVWTGSTNWTDDSWSLQENNIIVLHSQEIARYYTNDFNGLWVDGNIASSTEMDALGVTMRYGGQPAQVTVYFSPAEGLEIDQELADIIENTREKLTLASVVVTSGKVLNALKNLMDRGIPIEGMFDGTQMEGVKYQWEIVPTNHWKIPAWQEIVQYGKLLGKNSTPYTPESKHDYMHNKVLVSDGTVVTGSYNFSRHAQHNAENVLVIQSDPLAATYRKYIYEIMQRFASQQANAKAEPQVKPTQQSPTI